MAHPRRHRHLTGFFAATALLVAAPAADAGAPTERLREFFGKVNEVLADAATADQPLERVVRVRRLIADVADMPGAAAAALGPEWGARTRAEREQFVDLFSDVLERAYVGRLAGAARANGGIAIAYRAEVITGDDAMVATAIRGGAGSDLRVEYRMTRVSGRWRVRDIVIDGVSTVENYRAQFARIVQRAGFAGVVAQLRAKLAEETVLFAAPPRETSAAVARAAPADGAVVAAPTAESRAPQAERTGRSVEPPARSADAAARRAESPTRPAGVAARSVETSARPADETRPRQETPRPADVAARSQDPARPADPVSRRAAAAARPADTVAARRERAVVATATPAIVAQPSANPAEVAASDDDDVMGAALGALLIGLLGAGGAMAWRGRAPQRLWNSARQWRGRVVAHARRTKLRLH